MARTVTGGTITQALIDTQNVSGRVPYIKIYINSTDYSSRLLYLEHHEEAYRDRAIIGLSDRDGTLDTLDLDGQSFEIGYGYDSTAQGGTTTDKVDTATLWVKSHQVISLQGERVYQIYAEGMWMRLREQKMIAGVNVWKASTAYIEEQSILPTATNSNGHIYKCTIAGTSGATEPTWPTGAGEAVEDGSVIWTENGTAYMHSNTFNATHTVEELIQLIIESVGWTWTAVGTSDGLIDVFKPVFALNLLPFENAAALLYRLIWMTKSYLRAKPSTTFEAVYPQNADPVDEKYYSYQAHWFTEFDDKSILLIPNSIVVLCNQDPNGEWNTEAYPIVVGTASSTTEIAKYTEIIQPFIAGSITNQTDADNRADAIFNRQKAETFAGRLIIPHDARVELYDKIKVYDNRT